MNTIENYPKPLKLRIVENPNKQIIIDNTIQVSMMLLLSCPTCGKEILQIDNPQDPIANNIYLKTHKDEMERRVGKYCPVCGQSLKFDQLEIIEFDGVTLKLDGEVIEYDEKIQVND